MPKKLMRCVRKVSKTIKPRKKGQSKKSAAYAVCIKSTGQQPHRRGRKKRRKRG